MESKDIIKVLECCGYDEDMCLDCPIAKECESNELILEKKEKILELIKKQQAEIERFTKRQKPTGASGYKIENGKVVFFTNMLGGYREEKENLEEVVKTLNELLHECYSKDEIAFALKCKTEELKTAKTEAYKEFADKLEKSILSQLGISTMEKAEAYYYCLDCIKNILQELTERKEDEGK